MFSIIYSLDLKDFYEINLKVDAIVLKKLFKECWSFFYPNNMRLTTEEIVELLNDFDNYWLSRKKKNFFSFKNSSSNEKKVKKVNIVNKKLSFSNYYMNRDYKRSHKIEVESKKQELYIISFKKFCKWFVVEVCENTVSKRQKLV
jgi:hypothetical protein